MTAKNLIELISEGEKVYRKDNGTYISVKPIGIPKIINFLCRSGNTVSNIKKIKDFCPKKEYFDLIHNSTEWSRICVSLLPKDTKYKNPPYCFPDFKRKHWKCLAITYDRGNYPYFITQIIIKKTEFNKIIRKNSPDNSDSFILSKDMIHDFWGYHSRTISRAIQYFKIMEEYHNEN